MKAIQNLIDKVDKFQQTHRPLAFSYAVIKKYGDDSAGYHAALLTYYGFLALFPLLMILTTITNNLIGNDPELAKTIIGGITDYFPMLGNQLASNVDGLRSSGLALLAGILFTLYGARGVADVFRKGLQDVWDIPKKDREGFPINIIKSLTLVFVGGIGLIGASLLAGLAAAAGHGWEFRVLSLSVNLVILFVLFNVLLNLSLPKHVSFKQTWTGAIFAAVGLVILQTVGGYILAHELKGLDALYSYFALALGLLFWIYLQAQVIYYAAEVAVVSSKKLWPRSFK